jgi:hypothetical protein
MGRHIHRLSEVNPDQRTAICSNCGPVGITKNHYEAGPWHCSLAVRTRKKTSSWKGQGIKDLTVERFDEMVKEVGGRCLICGEVKPLVPDHDHETGEVRGVPCGSCNSALGLFKDSVETLEAAIRYLRRDLPRNAGQVPP